jgi:hypothetical protein
VRDEGADKNDESENEESNVGVEQEGAGVAYGESVSVAEEIKEEVDTPSPSVQFDWARETFVDPVSPPRIPRYRTVPQRMMEAVKET